MNGNLPCSLCSKFGFTERELYIHKKYFHESPSSFVSKQPTFFVEQPQKVASGVCPDCGQTLWYQEGCVKCASCGYTRC